MPKYEASHREFIDANVARAMAREFCYNDCGPGSVGHHKECVIHIWTGETVDRELKYPPILVQTERLKHQG